MGSGVAAIVLLSKYLRDRIGIEQLTRNYGTHSDGHHRKCYYQDSPTGGSTDPPLFMPAGINTASPERRSRTLTQIVEKDRPIAGKANSDVAAQR